MSKLLTVTALSMVAAVDFNTTNPNAWFSVNYNPTQNALQWNVTIPSSQTLNLFFGNGTTASDAVSFVATSAGTVTDKFGTITSSSTDSTNNWSNTTVTKIGTTAYQFVTSRFANSTDTSGKDTNIPCGKSNAYTWQLMPANTNGTWNLLMDNTCRPTLPAVNNPPAADSAKTLMFAGVASAALVASML